MSHSLTHHQELIRRREVVDCEDEVVDEVWGGDLVSAARAGAAFSTLAAARSAGAVAVHNVGRLVCCLKNCVLDLLLLFASI